MSGKHPDDEAFDKATADLQAAREKLAIADGGSTKSGHAAAHYGLQAAEAKQEAAYKKLKGED